jgi:hypothetical protein|uniref:hypothetical protein n=1 Tax=Hafnia alvei TaxID=569 RepID=UPI00242E9B16|nr:hypothetical protein [Hafnia alvei]
MRKLTVTIKGLEQHIDGVVCGASVDINVYQGNTPLESDKFTGKLSAPYSRNYDVDDADGDIRVLHNRTDLCSLEAEACLS